MAEEYGCRPAEIMHCTDMHPMDQFRFDADVFTATNLHKQEVRDSQDAQHDPNSAGVASTGEKQELVDRANQRAEDREQGQPDAAEQMQALEEIRQEREQATGDTPPDSDETDADAGPGSDGRSGDAGGMQDLGEVL